MTDTMRALVFEEIGRTAVMENRPGNVHAGPDSNVPVRRAMSRTRPAGHP